MNFLCYSIFGNEQDIGDTLSNGKSGARWYTEVVDQALPQGDGSKWTRWFVLDNLNHFILQNKKKKKT